MLSYAVKRIIRSPGLFAALLLGVILASTFFAGVNIGADTTAKAALDQELDQVPVDIVVGQYNLIVANSTTWAGIASKVAQVKDITHAEVISRATWYGNESFTDRAPFKIAGVSNTSEVYDGMRLVSGVNSLNANETYVWAGSKSAAKLIINDTIHMDFIYHTGYTYPPIEHRVNLTLKIVGFVELAERALSIASEDPYEPILYPRPQDQSIRLNPDNLLLVSWEKTFASLLDAIPSSIPPYENPFNTRILAYLDRNAVVNPWDIPSSLEAIRKITTQVNQVAASYGMSASNNLESTLSRYQLMSLRMRISFLGVALPVFFVAWYVGTTVSDVSYNLRRREIGLLLTKGFSNGQLFRMFMAESIFIAVLAGFLGIGLGFLLTPFFATFTGGAQSGTTPFLSPEVIVLTIAFSLAITLLSTFRPSRRASKLSAIDALREYVYVEEVKPYKQRWPWLAFSLGLYKMVMFLFGVDLAQVFIGRSPPVSNILLLILLAAWIVIDTALTTIGPLLFFWGFTKIFISGSVKFQELVTRTAKFLGDLGSLATKNIRRNPARTAAIAFMIALIIGYSFQTVGALASEGDYVVRGIRADIGADISIQPLSSANASSLANATEALLGVASATTEYSFWATLPSQEYSGMQIRAVDPNEWPATAYYESEWFTGNGVTEAFQRMRGSNLTIILERNIARYLEKKVGDNLTLVAGGSMRQMTIVGYFGPEVIQQDAMVYRTGAFWSYVSTGFFESLSGTASVSAKVLVRLENRADPKSVALEVQSLDSSSYVRSVAEELEDYQSDLSLAGSLSIRRIGVLFSIVAASIATGLVAVVSLQERKREASIMNARGLSFRQLVTMLLAENMAVVIFAAILGVVAGLIIIRADVIRSNATIVYSLVTYRMVFPPESSLLLSACLVLVFASVIVPVLLLTKRFISKTERIVRL